MKDTQATVITLLGSSFDHSNNSSSIKKEWFYNINSLNLYLASINGMNLSFNSIKFYEVDSIPFFQYTTQSNVDSSVQVPLSATAPFINYNSANFNYVGNITLNIDINTITNPSSIFNLANSGNIFIASESAASAG